MYLFKWINTIIGVEYAVLMTYTNNMDDRKKRIDELERDKQEVRASLDTLLENFGESLYSRTKDMQVNFDDIGHYKEYLNNIAATNTAIGKVEEKNRRYRELEDTIDFKEREEKERLREVALIYRKLGKALLENSAYNDFTFTFREQADALSSKLESLENRIMEIEAKEGGNVFTWIGKSAQGLVLKSFLSKAQESQEQLYHNVGERYSNRERESSGKEEGGAIGGAEGDTKGDIASLKSEIDKMLEVSRAAMSELSSLKDERRMISAGFGIDGNPQKQIQNLKNRINEIRDNLRNLYRTFGAQAAGIMDAEILPERKYFIDTIVTAEDSEIIGRAVKMNQTVIEYETTIGKLTASLAIDEENAKIEKFQRSIEDKNNRIDDLKRSINDLEENVRDSQAYIQELRKQL
jgi:prefoldin subunit 5